MGIGPSNLGGPGKKSGVHGCGTPMKKIYTEGQKKKLVAGAKNPGFAAAIEETPLGKVETTEGVMDRYKSMKDKKRKKNSAEAKRNTFYVDGPGPAQSPDSKSGLGSKA